MDFSEKDAADLAKIKEVMVAEALGGDARAAAAFASLMNAETERSKAVAPAAQEKSAAVAVEPSSWQETVSGKAVELEARAVA